MNTSKVYKDQGGDRLNVADGGTIVAASGSTVTIDAAGITTLAVGELQIDCGTDSVIVQGTGGHVIISGLPTSDPNVAGALYVSNGALKVSAG